MKLLVLLCLVGAMAMPQHNTILDMDHPLINPEYPIPPKETHEYYPNYRDVMAEVQEFLQLLPMDKIQILHDAYVQDVQYQETMRFLKSDQFQKVKMNIVITKEFAFIHSYFNDKWPWLKKTVLELRSFIECGVVFPFSNDRVKEGLSGFLEEVIALLPLEKLRQLYQEKMQNSAVFRSFIEIVTSAELKTLIQSAKSSPYIQEQLKVLLDHDVDVVKMLGLLGY